MKYALKKVRRIRIEDIATGASKATLNDLTDVTFQGSSETVYAEGADGAHLAAFDINKVSSMTATNGSIDLDTLALQVGTQTNYVASGTEISYRETHTLTAAEATAKKFKTRFLATGTAGKEIRYIYRVDASGLPDLSGTWDGEGGYDYNSVFTQVGSSPAPDQFTYDAETGEVTLGITSIAAGTVLVFDYYPTTSEYTEIVNDGNKFSISGKVIIDAWFTDLCDDTDVPLQIVLDKGKLSGEYNIGFGNQAATHQISVEATTTACSDDKTLWHLYVYDEDNMAEPASAT